MARTVLQYDFYGFLFALFSFSFVIITRGLKMVGRERVGEAKDGEDEGRRGLGDGSLEMKPLQNKRGFSIPTTFSRPLFSTAYTVLIKWGCVVWPLSKS